MATSNGKSGKNGTNGIGDHYKSAHIAVEEFVEQEFDYLICGGGTAGLTIAARLTENTNITVGVIEAGKNRLGDPLVDIPAMFLAMLNNPDYDWQYCSTPQSGNKGKIHNIPRGKLLGGSSGINYVAYVRGSGQDYDDWGELADDCSWSAANMKQYMRKHQTLEPVDNEYRSAVVDENHGTGGPIRTSFNDFNLAIDDLFLKAADQAAGFNKRPVDPWSGDHIGFYKTLATITRTGPNKGKRSYAAREYFQANEHRPNLKVITESLVARVLLENQTAVGVEFIHNGQRHTVKANREVIICAGALNSPQILELSGIGNPQILQAAGIDCHVDLPSVGENYQDHVITAIKYELNNGYISNDSIHKPEVMAAAQKAYIEHQGGPLAGVLPIQGFFPISLFLENGELDEIVESIQSAKAATPFQRKQWDQVIKHIKSDKSANMQFILLSGNFDLHNGVADQSKLVVPLPEGCPDRVTLAICWQYPVARGYVHIKCSDPAVHPEINPNYLSQKVDVALLGAGMKFAERLVEAPALKGVVGSRLLPEPEKFSIDTVQARRAAVEEYCLGEYHSCGTCAMGETVDSHLRVKGVRNLRVADASIFPNNVSGNIVSTIYMLAEKAADLIKEDQDDSAESNTAK